MTTDKEDNHSEKEKLTYLEALLQSNQELKITPESPLDDETIKALMAIKRIKNAFNHHPFNEASVDTDSRIFSKQSTWGQLQIEKMIATGGSGEVYLAYDGVLQRRVAVKFLSKKARLLESSKQFINEARRMAKVRHPHVMAVFGATTVDDITGFWAEHLIGPTLAETDLCTQTWRKKLYTMRQLCSAVAAIHDNQIVHGDIKPQNVIIEADRGPVLIDFGAGHDSEKNPRNHNNSFTPYAMAPELFKGHTASTASDVYALGVLFFYICSQGQYPRQADNYNELKHIVEQQHTIVFSHLKAPRACVRLIKSMLADQAQKRPTIDKVLVALNDIKQAPNRRNKRIAIGTILTFLITSSLILATSNHQLKQQQAETNRALTETESINNLMFDLLSSVSPGQYGKDVLLIDVLNQLTEVTQHTATLSANTQARFLTSLAVAQFNNGQHQSALQLINRTLDNDQLSPLIRAKIIATQASLINYQPNLSEDQRVDLLTTKLDAIQQLIRQHQLEEDDLTAKKNTIEAHILSKLPGQDNLDTAKTLYLQVLEHWQSLPFNDYNAIEQANLLNELGLIAEKKEQFKQAINYYSKSFELAEKHKKSTFSSHMITAKTNMASALLKSGQVKQGIVNLEQLHGITQNYYEPEQAQNLMVVINLASSYNQDKQFKQSLTLLEKYQKIFDQSSNNRSLLSLHYLSVVAVAQAGLKKYSLALNTYQKIISLSSETMGEEHEITIINRGNIAEVYNLLKQPQKAMEQLEIVRPLATKLYGIDHQITLFLRETEALAQHLLGDTDLAKKMIESVYQNKVAKYGDQNPMLKPTLDIRNKIFGSQELINHD